MAQLRDASNDETNEGYQNSEPGSSKRATDVIASEEGGKPAPVIVPSSQSTVKKPKRIGYELTLCIIPLKQFVRENLPPASPLAYILLAEPDELRAPDFISKVDVWLKLLKLKTEK